VSYAGDTWVEACGADGFVSMSGKNLAYSKFGANYDCRGVSFEPYTGQTEGGTATPTPTPSVTSEPSTTPIPSATTEPGGSSGGGSDSGGGGDTGGGSDDGGGTGGGGTSTTRSSPKWKTKWTHGYDVYNVWVTSGTKVTITPMNKLARSSSIKWIKNGKVAKICWKKKYKKGKYKFKAQSQSNSTWLASTYTFTITA
ncbi:MAG: hypothetical protein J5819_09245, partial [Eubacterium sp.]|nr:hypothetical protein [Eubacterium sp.]